MTNVEYDQAVRDAAGIRLLGGVDEAGRGPLAGPGGLNQKSSPRKNMGR